MILNLLQNPKGDSQFYFTIHKMIHTSEFHQS